MHIGGVGAELPLSTGKYASCSRWTLGAPTSNVGRCCLQRLTPQSICLASVSLHVALNFCLHVSCASYACMPSLSTVLQLLGDYLLVYACFFLCVVPPRVLYAAGAGVQHWTPA